MVLLVEFVHVLIKSYNSALCASAPLASLYAYRAGVKVGFWACEMRLDSTISFTCASEFVKEIGLWAARDLSRETTMMPVSCCGASPFFRKVVERPSLGGGNAGSFSYASGGNPSFPARGTSTGPAASGGGRQVDSQSCRLPSRFLALRSGESGLEKIVLRLVAHAAGCLG